MTISDFESEHKALAWRCTAPHYTAYSLQHQQLTPLTITAVPAQKCTKVGSEQPPEQSPRIVSISAGDSVSAPRLDSIRRTNVESRLPAFALAFADFSPSHLHIGFTASKADSGFALGRSPAFLTMLPAAGCRRQRKSRFTFISFSCAICDETTRSGVSSNFRSSSSTEWNRGYRVLFRSPRRCSTTIGCAFKDCPLPGGN